MAGEPAHAAHRELGLLDNFLSLVIAARGARHAEEGCGADDRVAQLVSRVQDEIVTLPHRLAYFADSVARSNSISRRTGRLIGESSRGVRREAEPERSASGRRSTSIPNRTLIAALARTFARIHDGFSEKLQRELLAFGDGLPDFDRGPAVEIIDSDELAQDNSAYRITKKCRRRRSCTRLCSLSRAGDPVGPAE